MRMSRDLFCDNNKKQKQWQTFSPLSFKFLKSRNKNQYFWRCLEESDVETMPCFSCSHFLCCVSLYLFRSASTYFFFSLFLVLFSFLVCFFYFSDFFFLVSLFISLVLVCNRHWYWHVSKNKPNKQIQILLGQNVFISSLNWKQCNSQYFIQLNDYIFINLWWIRL